MTVAVGDRFSEVTVGTVSAAEDFAQMFVCGVTSG